MSIDQYLKESMEINEGVLATTATLLLSTIAALGPTAILLGVAYKAKRGEKNLEKIKKELYPELSAVDREKFDRIDHFCLHTDLNKKPNLKKAAELFHSKRKMAEVKKLLIASLQSGELDDIPEIPELNMDTINTELDAIAKSN